jgi:3-oxoacyl-[acyl-carrier protein] reductase
MTVTAYIALGSNLGDRFEYLDRALQALQDHPAISVTQVSSYYETAPVGGPPGQGPYLNAAAELRTELGARELLQALLEVERALGRVRQERDGPRTIDLDLLLYGDLVCNEPELTVPHPRMHERPFVLKPLAAIAPKAVHPTLGRTAGELAERVPPAPGSIRGFFTFGPPWEREVITPPSFVPEVLATGGKALPPRELAGLRAVVTGSTSGIGRAIALELAVAGAHLVIHGRRSRLAAEGVAAEARTCGVRTQVILADLSQPDECRRLVDDAWGNWDGIDIWVNNAGADTLTGEASRWPFERKLQELWAVDVAATMLLSREAGRRMKEQGSGVILNMGWDQADTGMEGDSGQLFGATKAAVMAFSKSLALSLAPEVRVNCLAPGWIKTAWGERASRVWQERVRRETPLGRWGTPQDVAAAARWLASPAAAFVTGQVVRVNGGAVR